MRKLLFTLPVSLFVLLLLCSCEKKDYSSYCPTWKGFTYTTGSYPDYVKGNVGNNINLHPGDSIHLTAHQDQRGHLINYTVYTWTICYDTLDTGGNEDPTDDVVVHATKTYPQPTNYDGYEAGYSDGKAVGSADPICHLLLPENALPTEYGKRDTIKFVARYVYSGQGVIVENGNIVDNTSYNGRITPQSGPTGGGAAGYFYFNVVK